MALSRHQRHPLTRERVLQAALVLADRDGLESLSMRKLGQQLGVEAMSLYNHVANKDDIIRGIFDLVVSGIELPPEGVDWKTAIRQSTVSAHLTLRSHPWACGLIMVPNMTSEGRLRWMDAILRCLREAGCSVELTHHAYHALDSHIVGFTLWQTGLPASGDDLRELAASMVEQPPFSELPYLVEHMRYHIDEPHLTPEYEGTSFEFGLDLILHGVDRLRAG